MIPTSGYDIVSTRYIYEDGKVVTAEDDWTLNGGYGFEMRFRVNFEKGNIIFEKGSVKINPNDGEAFTPELPEDNGYYGEIKYFAEALLNNTPIETAAPHSTMETIRIAQAEMESADNGGKLVQL